MINTTSERLTARNFFICRYFSMKFILLINVKMPTIVGMILTFISMINTTSERLKARKLRFATWNRFKPVCLYVLCGHLFGKGWPLGYRLWCLTVSLSLSHWYPGQTWGQILWKVFKYITITLTYQWLQLHYNYRTCRNVMITITLAM